MRSPLLLTLREPLDYYIPNPGTYIEPEFHTDGECMTWSFTWKEAHLRGHVSLLPELEFFAPVTDKGKVRFAGRNRQTHEAYLLETSECKCFECYVTLSGEQLHYRLSLPRNAKLPEDEKLVGRGLRCHRCWKTVTIKTVEKVIDAGEVNRCHSYWISRNTCTPTVKL